MSPRQFVVAALALLGGAYAASSCCFVVQDQASEVFWPSYATETLTVAVNLTSITTLLTVYPTTTITNVETNIYPTTKASMTSHLVNPVALYTNPGNAIPQKTEMLAGSESVVTGGLTLNSPTGFWVYATAQIYAAPAVTDSNGNVACGTLSSFSSAATDPAACIPTFSGINSNAAATFVDNATQGVQISLTAPYIHIPTRTGLQISPTESCAQGNGTENYGYPPQELINHLAGNAFYSAQYPGIENCLPAGPTIKAVEALALAVTSADPAAASDPPASSDPPSDPPAANSTNAAAVSSASSASSGDGGTTESAGGGGLTSSTTIIVTSTGTTTSSTSISGTAAAASSSTTSATSTSVATALPDTTSSTPSGGVTETAVGSGGLLPTSPPSSTSSTSLSIVTPLLETMSAPVTNSTSSQTTTASSSTLTSKFSTSSTSSTSQASSSSAAASSTTSSLSTSSTEPSTVELVLPSSVLIPTSNLPGFTGSLTTISSSAFVIVSSPTTIPLVIVGSTSIVPTASGPPQETGSSMKDFVPWKLLVGLTGLAALGAW